MTRSALLLSLSLVVPAGAAAQGLRDKIGQLFIFGSGEQPLFLAGTAGNTSVQAHAGHFVPSAVGNNATLISFLTSAIGTSIAAIPISATSSGTTFRFEGGVPVRTSTSPGPIIGERSQTLGKGRVWLSALGRMIRSDPFRKRLANLEDAVYGDCAMSDARMTLSNWSK